MAASLGAYKILACDHVMFEEFEINSVKQRKTC